jgi:hypothetical protein
MRAQEPRPSGDDAGGHRGARILGILRATAG